MRELELRPSHADHDLRLRVLEQAPMPSPTRDSALILRVQAAEDQLADLKRNDRQLNAVTIGVLATVVLYIAQLIFTASTGMAPPEAPALDRLPPPPVPHIIEDVR